MKISADSPAPATGKRFIRVWRWRIVTFTLLAFAGYLYFRTVPKSIEVVVRPQLSFELEDDEAGAQRAGLQTTITNRAACDSVLRVLRAGTIGKDHKCADVGFFKIRYVSGNTEIIKFLPGHDPKLYELRPGGRLSRKEFYQTLQEAGVDTSKLPQSEH